MYVILGVALFLTLCVIRYVSQVRSRLHQVALRYPTCFKELPIVGSLYHLLHNSSEELLSNMLKAVDISAQLGGIGRLCGLNYYYLVVTDAADIGEVLKHYLNKDFICTYVQRITFQGSIFNTDHTVSKDRRHIMLPSFNSKQLPGYIDSTWRAAVRLSQTLAPYAGKGPFRIAYFLGGFCYDSVIGAADVEEIREEFSSGKACFNLLQCFQLAVQRWTSMWMQADLLHQLSRNHREMTRRVATLYTYMDRAQEIRRNKLNNIISQQSKDTTGSIQIKPGLFDSLICSKLTRREVSEEILVMMGATDEASVVIYFTLRMLGLYPIVQKRVYEELLNISVEPDQPVEYLTKTPYLDLVIKEVMRLYPPVPVVIRAAHTEMELPSGSVLPAGAGIFVSIMSLHRRQKYWGDDADHFDPERFLPERLAVVPDDAYIPFSSGSRSCPGYKFALNTVKLGVCAILRRYAVAGPPAAGAAPDVRVKFEVTLRPVDDSIELVERNVNA